MLKKKSTLPPQRQKTGKLIIIILYRYVPVSISFEHNVVCHPDDLWLGCALDLAL
jgi:hypothetical protein